MGGNFQDLDHGSDGSGSIKGKVILSKCAVALWIIVTIIVIVAVGLLAGLLGKETKVIEQEVTTKPAVFPSTTSGVIIATTNKMPSTTTNKIPDTTAYPPGPWSNIRLPSNLVPYHYLVDLQPNLEPISPDYYVFNGISSVDFMVMEATKYIIIHSNKLNYTDVRVQDDNMVEQAIMRHWFHEENQYLVVELQDEMMMSQNYTLLTTFTGELADDLGGIYRSSYTNSSNKQVVIATTQMQPTDARKAFPCFDEPALKATFDIYLWHKDPYFALSNMPNITTETMNAGWMRTQFDTTVKMSTYLLAFVVCDFDYVENDTTSFNFQARIYARPQQIANGNGDYARDITPYILEHFENFFNVSYPLPKSDQIAVADFAAGAMENWGLIIYRETALLYDPMINSASNQQRVAAVVAHELAHQWFGNLISPLWWDELWLNEGFASYVEYIGTNAVEPTWRMEDQFVISDLHSAMSVDALTTSRPIVAQNVNTPADINALFDTISYSKGACILRMINHFTGDEAFKLGLKNYLEDFAYGPVNHNQLFEYWEKAISETTGVNNPPGGFISSMDTWMLQMGYPVINMMRDDNSSENVKINQERFLLDPEANLTLPASNYSYMWNVPLWYASKSNANKDLIWIERNKPDVEVTVPTSDYFIGNYEAFGYYRVNYDEDNWSKIIQQLKADYAKIEVKTRAQIIDDAFNLARAKRLSYTIALNLTSFLRDDFDYIPWESALDVMSYFDLMLGRSKVYGVYSQYLLYLVEPVYDSLTWTDGGSHLEQYQRINAIGAACGYGHVKCIQNATEMFNGWKETGINKITPNLKTTVYCNAIANGGAEEWDFAWEKYLNESNSQEKGKIEYALSCTRIPWIIRRYLDYALDVQYVRKQDASSIFQDLCYNEYARDITWDFVRQEWDYIYDVYGTGFFSFSGIISSCTSHFSTQFELDELEDFKTTNAEKLGSGVASVEQGIEKTKTNIQWRIDNEEDIFTWLSDTLANLP